MSVPTLYNKCLVSFLYFLQGVFLAIPRTVILIYQIMPGYETLALFSMATLPFSTKFIVAPIIEKYTSKSYGRRKTWLVISLIMASLLIILSTLFTKQQKQSQTYLAICFTGAILMIAIQDICTDALSIKELYSVELATYLQCTMQPIGYLFGSLGFFQLVSGTLYLKLGFTDKFLTVNQFLYIFGGCTLLSAIVIHQSYKEKISKEEEENEHFTLWQVVSHYKYFVNIKYSLCRQGIIFLIHNFGINFFNSTYTVQLIKNEVISKDVFTSLQNFCLVIYLFMAAYLKKYLSNINLIHKRTRYVLAIRVVLMAFLFFNTANIHNILIYFFLMVLYIVSVISFFLNSMICNNFPDSKFAGLYVTIMASFLNFGNNTTIHQEVISKVGINDSVQAGFIYSLIIIAFYGIFQRWIKKGQKCVQSISTGKSS